MAAPGIAHVLADGRSVTLRPVTAQDEAAERRFFARLSPRTRELRFHHWGDAPNAALAHFYTHVDHRRHEAFVCEHGGEIVGEARYVAHRGGTGAEFAIVVADDWRHTGVAPRLMRALIDAASSRGFGSLEGLVRADNSAMLRFVKRFGFDSESVPAQPATVRVVKRL
jgi:acetyltransferase